MGNGGQGFDHRARASSRLNSSLARTFRPHGKLYLDLRSELDEHAESSGLHKLEQRSWATRNSACLLGAGAMRSLQTSVRLRF